MKLNQKDIVISVTKADHEQNLGQWSTQSVSGIVAYHKPTGVQVICTKHKSQWKNKEEAIRMLEEKVKLENPKLLDITEDLGKLKRSLGRYNLSCEEYDILYGDIELIQYKIMEVYDEKSK